MMYCIDSRAGVNSQNATQSQVINPRNYPWSSYCHNAEGKASDILTPHDQFTRQAVDELDRRKAYRGWYCQLKGESVRLMA